MIIIIIVKIIFTSGMQSYMYDQKVITFSQFLCELLHIYLTSIYPAEGWPAPHFSAPLAPLFSAPR